jgi:DNA-binding transcriptional LysR family regulator
MPRQEVNRSGEMEVFVRAVELGGFSPAARALRMTPSAVSKLVARLEKRLGARLINRSTRKLLLTAEGQAFVERAHRVLADLDEAERAVAAGAVPHSASGVVPEVTPRPGRGMLPPGIVPVPWPRPHPFHGCFLLRRAWWLCAR